MNLLTRFLLILIYVIVCFGILDAQVKVTNISVAGKFVPSSNYVAPKDSVKWNGQSQQREFNLQVNMLLSRKADSTTKKFRQWTASFGTNYISFGNDGYASSLLPSSLLASYVGVQHFRTLRNNWSLVGLLSAGVNTDLEKVTGEDLFVNIGLIGMKQFTRTFSMGFGVIVHNNFGTPLVWPALLVNWNPGSRYKLDIRVPDNGPGLSYKVGLSYQLQQHSSVEFVFRPSAMTYDVERTATLKDYRLMSLWQLPIGLEWQFEKNGYNLFAGAGLMALRSYSFGEKDLSKMFKKYPAHGIGPQAYMNLGVSIKFK